MTKKHERFLLKRELAKAMLVKVWAKGMITDDEKNRASGIISEKSANETDAGKGG